MAHDVNLGKVPSESACRDAVHVAVIPVTSSQFLQPGDYVAKIDGEYGYSEKGGPNAIGIVDPFRLETIRPNTPFWLFLLPNTVTGMRHHWEHPEFSDGTDAPTKEVSESEAWLRAFLGNADFEFSYEELLLAATSESKSHWIKGEYEFEGKRYPYEEGIYIWDDSLHSDGKDAHGSIPPEFWDHVEVVTGVKQTVRPTYFSCSC